MKKRILTLTVMFTMAIGALAFSSATTGVTTVCTSGDTGICVDVLEGKGCKRIDPDFIGDCGGTSVEEVNPE
jgi:hypothetical protein